MLNSLEAATTSTFKTPSKRRAVTYEPRTTVPKPVETEMVTECPRPVYIGSGDYIPTLRNAFQARMAALSSKHLMCCSASSTFQRPLVDMSLQVAPQPVRMHRS